MKKNLEDLLNATSSINRANTKYYKLNDFDNLLNQLDKADIEIDDTILTPFYICDQGILEIYDYELNVRQVEKPNEDSFILTKTGRKSINEIDPIIEQKLRHCYLEIIGSEGLLPLGKLKEYVSYVKDSSEIKKRISDVLHEFNDDNLYFEVF